MKKAITYMILSTLFFTCVNAAIKYVDHLSTMQLVFFRAFGTVLCCLLMLKLEEVNVWGNNKKWLIARAIVGLIAMSIFFKTLQIMPIATAVSLRYLSPFFAAALAILFLGEKMKKLQWLFFFTAFMGVIILKGFDSRISLFGLSLSLMAALGSGTVYVIIRKMGVSEHPAVVVFYFMLLATLVGGVSSIFTWVSPQGIEWAVLFSMGLFGFFGQLYMTKALQSTEANLIVPFKYSEVIFTLIVGWFLFGEYQTWWTMAGMAIIVFSLLANVWVKTDKG